MLDICYGLIIKMIKRYLPKSLLIRAVSIVIVPMILFQLIIVTVFFDSLWERVISRMSRSVAMEIALTINQIKNNNLSIKEANADYGSYTEINFIKVDSNELIADYAINNIEYLDFITTGFRKELQGILQSTHWVQSDGDFINVHINAHTYGVGSN